MSIGPSSQEKSQLGQLQGLTTSASDLAGTAGGRGGKTFKQFEKALTPALDYWRSILSGDRTAMAEAAGPTVSQIGREYDASERSLSALNPRGGVSASGFESLEAAKAGKISDLYASLQPMAAQNLASLGTEFGGMSTGQSGLALSGLGQAMQGTQATLSILDQWRQQENQFWSQLGTGLASLALLPFTGGLSLPHFGGGGSAPQAGPAAGDIISYSGPP